MYVMLFLIAIGLVRKLDNVHLESVSLFAELRGKDLLDADLRTLESYSSFVQGVFQSFKVPLQNEYDPDQVAAYFHRRPHVLLLRFLEVHYFTCIVNYGE